jgi:dihydropteroate synthase
VLEFGARPLIMGILNATPDSFSDGGKFDRYESACDHGRAMAAAGADLIDIGGESTRPYSTPIAIDEELRRTIEVVRTLSTELAIPISIDTSKSAVAASAVEAGAEIINDVTGMEGDPRMVEVAVASGAGLCVMHMQGTPQTMQDAPRYEGVVDDIQAYLAERVKRLTAAGVSAESICLDPGIGFGKTHQHNLTLMANAWRFHSLGHPLLFGHSRKGFIGKVLGDSKRGRTSATVGASLALARQGVQVIRVHDVAATREALALFADCGGIDGRAGRLDT